MKDFTDLEQLDGAAHGLLRKPTQPLCETTLNSTLAMNCGPVFPEFLAVCSSCVSIIQGMSVACFICGGRACMCRKDMKLKGHVLLLGGIVLTLLMTVHGHAIAQRSSTPALSSPEKLEAEQRLWDLGYWAGPVDGEF
ncbi:MAG TPA: hypothetical protein VFS77_00580, partial [Pyrinomonadaceae bacterium]|nr:hypothetical protein [Pyrinomonadaceae bacterium]